MRNVAAAELPATKRKANKMSNHHEHISGLFGVGPDIGDKVSDDSGHTGYGHCRSEAEAALRVAQENNVAWAENDTSIIGSILPGHCLGDKLDE